jgi:CubicO group peptidase (beta-lactamase class C family)
MKRTLLALCIASSAFAQDWNAVDKAANEILQKSGAPSFSVAVVKDGKLAYAKAYGLARIEPPLPATAQMRYSIGSISKQFTAAALLMLAEEGKLSLDDKVGKWLPDLTRANDVSIRQLLSMTSGYQDFWPQDYVMPGMLQAVTPQEIFNQWAKKPLDFEPGAKWQYSNTNYVIAGVIAEKASGMPLLDYLQKRVFSPLHMTSVVNTDAGPLGPDDPTRYHRYALGPLRVAPKEGAGWMFAAGELAMTASDLAQWDIAVMNGSLMSPLSYRQLATEVLLTSGVGSRYGLGVGVAGGEHRLISHGGEVSGFTATNHVYPDERAAVVVLANLDATSASGDLARRIATLLFATTDPSTPKATELARKIFEGLQKGEIDRSLFTSNANAYFSDVALKDFASSLGPLGALQEFTQTRQSLRGGMTSRGFRAKFANKTVNVSTFTMPDGKIEQFMVAPAD